MMDGQNQIPVAKSYFSLLQNAQTAPRTNPASCLMNVGGSFLRESGRETEFTSRLGLIPRLRMSGAMRFLPPYAFMARTGKILLFFYLFSYYDYAISYTSGMN